MLCDLVRVLDDFKTSVKDHTKSPLSLSHAPALWNDPMPNLKCNITLIKIFWTIWSDHEGVYGTKSLLSCPV